MRIDSFAVMPAMNFSAAISTFVGQNIGANKFERIGSGLKSALIMITAISITVTITALIFAGPLIALFTDSLEVIEIGKQYIYIVTPFYIVFQSCLYLMVFFGGLATLLSQ